MVSSFGLLYFFKLGIISIIIHSVYRYDKLAVKFQNAAGGRQAVCWLC